MAYINQGGVIFFGSTTSKYSVVSGEEHPDGQFWLWSPLMIFSLVMACVVGLIILILLLYFLFYYCVYGTCCCPGCWWCPQAAPAVQEEPVKVHVRRPSRSDSCRSSVRSRSSSVCSHYDHDDRKLVRINSCPSINGSVMGVQPMIIQTIPAIQAAPQIYQQPLIQAAPTPLPPPAPPVQSGFGGGELRVVIGEGKPAASNSRSDNVIVYDMARSNGSGITLGGGGGRREYELTSVDDFGGTYRAGAYNDGFDRDDGSYLSERHRSAVIDIGKGGGNFYPSLPHYDD